MYTIIRQEPNVEWASRTFSLLQSIHLALPGNLIQPGVIWEGNLNWTISQNALVGMYMEFSGLIIDVGRPSPLWAASFPGQVSGSGNV